jgi:hypothetical protein
MQRVLMALIPFMIDQPGFHNPEKRLGHSVAPTVSLARHALNETMVCKFFAKIPTGILDPTIRMKDKVPIRLTSVYGPFERGDNHLMAQRAAQRPADPQPREEIDDHHQVQPAPAGTTTMWRGLVGLQAMPEGFGLCKTQRQRDGP